jgi:hypothetical protein
MNEFRILIGEARRPNFASRVPPRQWSCDDRLFTRTTVNCPRTGVHCPKTPVYCPNRSVNPSNLRVYCPKLIVFAHCQTGVFGQCRSVLGSKRAFLDSADQSWAVNGRLRTSLGHPFHVALIPTFFQIMDFSTPESLNNLW